MNKENAGNQETEIRIVKDPINTNGKVEIDVMMKLCQRVLDGKEMLEDWKTSVMVPIYKGKRDVTNCRAYRESH